MPVRLIWRVDVTKAEGLLGAVHHLLTEPEDRRDQGSTAPSLSNSPVGRASPFSPVLPGKEGAWDPWAGKDVPVN